MSGTKGEVEYAVRRALNKFDEWNDVTSHTPKFCGYYYEIQAVITDAVHCGFQRALDQEGPLPSEVDSETDSQAEGDPENLKAAKALNIMPTTVSQLVASLAGCPKDARVGIETACCSSGDHALDLTFSRGWVWITESKEKA